MEEKKHTVLCVDDERNILQSLKRLLRKESYHLLLANSGDEAFKLLEANKVHLIISDQRMPEMNGTEFMAVVKERYPDALRVILTGYTDVDSITESINKGHIYKFFLKPWNDHNLKLEIRQALDQYDLIKANKQLDETVLRQNQELQKINENLENMVEARTTEIALKNHALELSHAVLENLPIAVLGIDKEGMIVLANEMAQHNIKQGPIKIGLPISQYFEKEAMEGISQAFNGDQQIFFEGKTCDGQPYKARILSLDGKFRGKGVIMTFSILA
jgi:response regulator RpfG family c-di-GMP phosphodiesterase